MKPWKISGHLLFATGVLHNVVGLVMGWDVISAVAQEGFINTINMQMDRNAMFWFFFSGCMMMLAGRLMQAYIGLRQGPLPKSYGYALLAIAIVGCAIMPVTGVWLAFPQAFIIIFAPAKKD